jgi:hypothetical protein
MGRSAFVIVIAAAVGLLGVTIGCVRRSNHQILGQEIPVPAGLDTAQTRAWIAEQEQRCPGRLMRLSDRIVFAVVCQDSNPARRPPNVR